jgi:hypothetical protein
MNKIHNFIHIYCIRNSTEPDPPREILSRLNLYIIFIQPGHTKQNPEPLNLETKKGFGHERTAAG